MADPDELWLRDANVRIPLDDDVDLVVWTGCWDDERGALRKAPEWSVALLDKESNFVGPVMLDWDSLMRLSRWVLDHENTSRMAQTKALPLTLPNREPESGSG